MTEITATSTVASEVGKPLTRKQCLASALLDAQAGVDALRRGQPLAADIYLKMAIHYINESGVLP